MNSIIEKIKQLNLRLRYTKMLVMVLYMLTASLTMCIIVYAPPLAVAIVMLVAVFGVREQIKDLNE